MVSAVLDLAGVLLLGLVALMASASTQGNEFPAIVDATVQTLGLDDMSQVALIGLVGGAAALILILKSIGSVWVLRGVFRFLANRAALVSARLSSKFFSSSLLMVQKNASQQTAYGLGAGANAAVLGVLGAGMIIVTEVALLVLLGSALLFIDPIVTVGAVVYFALISAAMQRPLGRWARRIGGVSAAAEIASTTIVQEGIDCYREVSILDRRSSYHDRFREQRILSAGATADIQFIGLIPKSTMEVALVVGAALLALSQFVAQDAVSAVATLVIFLAAGSRVMPSLLKLQGALVAMHNSSANAEVTYALAESLANVEPREDDPVPALVIRERIKRGNPDFSPSIEVEGVSVTYPGSSVPALSGVSLSVPPGTSLGLAGSTGAGKSTLADVILGVLTPDAGSVLIGGEPPESAVLKWAGGISYVPQEVALGHSTVRENVALGLPRDAVDDALVWEALERAHLENFLRGTREGLDTLVGEKGVRLSGGQRQRLGVARALYTRPSLLVLDEATSALDAKTEHSIAETLSSLEGQVTTVIVAHRLATIRHADLVMYLEGGVAISSGTFDEVRSKVPKFNHQAQLLGL